ncbi:unnamed protein product [Didymodactylos carnosus]|uniref:Uncharacterized protein n=2 Tax=Didymodactylos carnosus TaxID=1234261 RepID=A0A813ZCB5_9BILA|nr:unnamed protein product [Didymodactylos carnosus]CAF3679724.1 unnamed protein product [Didymodactylos carnosus]
MATAIGKPTTTSKSNNNKLETLVKCPICLDYYEDPRLLQCSHTFCFKCILQLVEKNGGYYATCPLRDNTILRRHTIDQLPINRAVQDMVDHLKKEEQQQEEVSTYSSKFKQLATKCDECNGVIAEFYCDTCKKHFCTACLKQKHSLAEFETHKIIVHINEKLSPLCKEHAEEKLKYWCTGCKLLVCSDCLLFQHKHHSFIPMQEIVQQTKIKFGSSLDQLDQMKQNLTDLSTKTTEAQNTHYRAHVVTRKEIEQTIAALQNMLETRKEQLINQLTTRDAEQQEIIRRQRNDIDEQLKTVSVRELLIKQILSTGNSIQILNTKDDLLTYNELHNEQYEQLMEGCVYDISGFVHIKTRSDIKQKILQAGNISSQAFLADSHGIRGLITLSLPTINISDQHSLQIENYAHGYRFLLANGQKTFKLKSLRINGSISNELHVYILDYNDVLVYKQTARVINDVWTTLKWSCVSLTTSIELQNNYYLFVWSNSPRESSKSKGRPSYLSYKNGNHNLRAVNDHISVRSKRSLMTTISDSDLQIGTKFNVVYDAFLTNEKNNEWIPSIDMILELDE